MSITGNVPDGTFVKEIAELVHPESQVHDLFRKKVVVIGSEMNVFDDPSLPTPTALKASTLAAVVAYVTANLADEKIIVNVVSPSQVQIVAPMVGDQRQQFVYLTSSPVLPEVVTGTTSGSGYLGIEQFLIQLQSCFAPSETRDALQKFCGRLRAGLAKEIEDDGITQKITATAGLTRSETVPVQNPWKLAPYRTFPEIIQPESAYVLRMKQRQVGDALGAEATLIEADGGAWRAEAISMIGAWLKAALPEGTVVLS